MAYGDFNNDGKQDFVVNNVRIEKSNSGNALLHINNGAFNNNWVKVMLEGTSSNKSAYGSNVTLSSENRSWIKELSGGSSYLSSHSNTLHFGLADKESIDELIVSWPGNKKEMFTELQVNKTYKIIEGDGIYEYSLNYLELCEGENVFLQGEERTESGIYKDVINNTGQISKILGLLIIR